MHVTTIIIKTQKLYTSKQYFVPEISVKGLTFEVVDKLIDSRVVHIDDEIERRI